MPELEEDTESLPWGLILHQRYELVRNWAGPPEHGVRETVGRVVLTPEGVWQYPETCSIVITRKGCHSTCT